MPQPRAIASMPFQFLSTLNLHSLTSVLLTWRTLALLLLVTNLKSLPLAWHFRLTYRFVRNLLTPQQVTQSLRAAAAANAVHPIFAPATIRTSSPLLEGDYNLHKSNSTYFTDLDESRTALCTRLLSAGLKAPKPEQQQSGANKGRLSIILGSVHTSFHKEIKMYSTYEVRSRIIGWDRKWLLVGSWFVRPAPRGGKETLLASALSKYVIKRGRRTISPEHCLQVAGWLPARPEGVDAERGVEASGVLVPSNVETEAQTPVLAPAVDTAAKGVEAVVEKLEKVKGEAEEIRDPVAAAAAGPVDGVVGEWDWHRIEQERLRGLKIVEAWMALDGSLKEEFEHEL
ncbi:uncharacterized protein HMPREF1541_10310 [Cyphellophora europaea CBS 101466]|uniref:Uncharacterized protein n=1 Tax=Cyphellophora europaea (strain CBS 101466) TaxID=1220924 RepID=W2S7M9_CYPE1|nr:uncharacterized protein HMPREF1541_10310 [Cyphellophora europaea CBS 101466]ETN44640.1 hypothetical protein HMPREF1541_10310 [Cyphellophora europaea CBS 101466]